MLLFGTIAHPTHLIWLYLGVESPGLMFDLHDDATGTRLTPWLYYLRWIYLRTCNFALFLAIFRCVHATLLEGLFQAFLDARNLDRVWVRVVKRH